MAIFRVFCVLFLAVLLACMTATAQPPAVEPAPTVRASEPGYFGVLATNAANGEGALLAEVVAGSPAAEAGLQSGDVISAVADTPVRSARELIEVLSAYASGETVTLGVRQSGFLKDIVVTLGQRPAPPRRRFSDFGRVATMPTRAPQPVWIAPDTLLEDRTPADQRLGIHTVPATSAALKRRRLPDRPGALVMRIERDSPADLAGIPVGALITSVDNVAVHSPQSLVTAMNETAGAIELKYWIGDEERTCRLQRDTGKRP
jgi:S1-C subfamily serine protease